MKTIRELRASISAKKASIEAHKMLLADAYKSFGKAFRERRVQENLSLRDVGKKLGLTAPYLSDIELGRRNPNEAVMNFFT